MQFISACSACEIALTMPQHCIAGQMMDIQQVQVDEEQIWGKVGISPVPTNVSTTCCATSSLSVLMPTADPFALSQHWAPSSFYSSTRRSSGNSKERHTCLAGIQEPCIHLCWVLWTLQACTSLKGSPIAI